MPLLAEDYLRQLRTVKSHRRSITSLIQYVVAGACGSSTIILDIDIAILSVCPSRSGILSKRLKSK